MSKYDLTLSSPLMNAAGSLGFRPDPSGPIDLNQLGAFITNPISLRARSPAHGTRLMQFSSSFLLHTGFPNPGFREAVRRYHSQWARSSVPVLIHLLYQGAEKNLKMGFQLEQIEGVAGIEIGLPAEVEPEMVRELIIDWSIELPTILRLPLDCAVWICTVLGNHLTTRFYAISLGPPRAALAISENELVHGRYYGPALYPLALAAVERIAKVGVPVIGAGGVYSEQQVQALLSSGAIGVQLDSVLWKCSWPPEWEANLR